MIPIDVQGRSGSPLSGPIVGWIAQFKILRHIRFVDGFPMAASGKVQRFVVRVRMDDAPALGDSS